MTRQRLRSAAIQSGSTLFACSLVMLGVALLTSASLRSLEDGISLTHNAIDRRLAQRAAEAALHDAAMTLAMVPDQLTIGQALGAHPIGDITGAYFPFGGYLQPGELPAYVLEELPQPDIVNHAQAGNPPPNIYRVTAHGKGRNDLTTIILQADFALQLCKTGTVVIQNPAQEAEQKAEQSAARNTGKNDHGQSAQQDAGRNTEQNIGQDIGRDPQAKPAKCVPGVRRLAWRLLHAT